MLISFIICTKNRAPQLRDALGYVAAAIRPEIDIEMILVDNGSNDLTKSVISNFADKSPVKVKCVDCETPGSGAARGAGVLAASGEWVIFTDDDCYIEQAFFANFSNFVTTPLSVNNAGVRVKYGAGAILPYDDQHDPRITNFPISQVSEIPPYSLIPAGVIHSANMFVHRDVFAKIGSFNEAMGAGTPFPCEDIEFATRASLAGFVGAQVPFFKVIHHHKRATGSIEANKTIESYDYGRGAYYASLLARGITQAWQLWEATGNIGNPTDAHSRIRLAREFEGATNYLKILNNQDGSR
jgi:glycosyltransferase involved in cell wall biosynthesis